MTTFEIITASIGTVTALILLLQVRLGINAVKADHERRKKQATFEFIQEIRPAWMEAKYVINERWGEDPLTLKDIHEIDNDFEIFKLVRNLLNLLEHLSVSMNSGVFDKDLFYRMSGSSIIFIHFRFRSYIENVQKNQPKVYIEFQELAKDFEERRRLRPVTQGDIVNS